MMSPPDEASQGLSEAGFGEEEYRVRLDGLREQMALRSLDLCLVSTPENIFYLTGLDHWGYFVPHMLIVPQGGEMVLVTRQMEQVTVANQVRHAAFRGYEDHETAADVVVRLLSDRARAKERAGAAAAAVVDAIGGRSQQLRRIGIEKWSAGLPHGLAESLAAALEGVEWPDISGLIDAMRRVKSPREQNCMRAAAKISDAGMAAAIEAVHDGARERDIAAECHRAMIQAGGTFPGFGPFIRSTARLGEEHTSWGDGVCRAGDVVFLELSGCYRRYHAPLGRLVFVGRAPPESVSMAQVCVEAFDAAVAALAPGVLACDVYRAWQEVVNAAGLSHYRRHHCGYLVGIGFPPSWTGGNSVTGLRHDSDLEIRPGMSFHMLSWLMGTGRGDYFVSDTVLLGPDGPEVLTRTPCGPIEKR
jgi:Xaa-Pro dipeptidase